MRERPDKMTNLFALAWCRDPSTATQKERCASDRDDNRGGRSEVKGGELVEEADQG